MDQEPRTGSTTTELAASIMSSVVRRGRAQLASEAGVRPGLVPAGGDVLGHALDVIEQSRQDGRTAVLVNVVGLTVLGEPEDYRAVVALVDALGARRVASIQNRADSWAGSGAGAPLVTAAVRTLIAAGADDKLLAEEREACARAGYQLLFEDATTADPRWGRADADDLRALLYADLATVRSFVAWLAANPWGSRLNRVRELAKEVGSAALEESIAVCASLLQARSEDEERNAVAAQIRSLVVASGRSQREFAESVGTSASRLSTYVNGKVTPSAAMMLRITRVARAMAAESAERQSGRPGRAIA